VIVLARLEHLLIIVVFCCRCSLFLTLGGGGTRVVSSLVRLRRVGSDVENVGRNGVIRLFIILAFLKILLK
jgi:hypothetical protein